MTDEEHVELVQKGIETDANYAVLVERNRGRVLGYSVKLSHNLADAEDATQNAFITAYKRINRFDRSRATFYTWVCAIAHNYLLKMWRERRREARCLAKMRAACPTCEEGPDPAWQGKCARAVLKQVLDRSPEHDREAFEGHFGRRLSYAKLSKLTGDTARHLRYVCAERLAAARKAFELAQVEKAVTR
jgi:RNA polymerase sigma-70 factor (ECF subfamily)